MLIESILSVIVFTAVGILETVSAYPVLKNTANYYNTSNIPISEFTALEQFYNATNGDFWIYTANNSLLAHEDANPVGNQWNFTGSTALQNPCLDDWQGVRCDCNSSDENDTLNNYCHVTSITLISYNLTGTLPNCLPRLPYLRNLALAFNTLIHQIPQNIEELSNLISLDLSSNFFTGSFPVFLTSLPQLKIIDIGYNRHLNGTIPTELTKMSNLKVLGLGYCNFSGTIPYELGQMTNLTQLALSGNKLNGTIPESFGNLTQIKDLLLFNNNLTGTIPSNLSNMKNLTHLRLSYNQLSGTIPNSLTECKNMTIFNLANNTFVGTINRNFSLFTRLRSFSIAGNFMTGTVPYELAALKHLRILTLNNNYFTGSLPSIFFQQMTKMNRFWVNNNLLTGTIPDSIGYMSKLNDLSLYVNYFSGSLPQAMNNLTMLTTLYIHENLFTGEIQNYTSTKHMQRYVAHTNQFSGNVPNFGSELFRDIVQVNIHTNMFTGTLCDKFVHNKTIFTEFDTGKNFLTGTFVVICIVYHMLWILYFRTVLLFLVLHCITSKVCRLFFFRF